MLDVVYYPFFERLPVVQNDHAGGAPLLSPRLRNWMDAMRERASVQATLNPVEAHVHAAQSYMGMKPQRRRVGNVEYLHA